MISDILHQFNGPPPRLTTWLRWDDLMLLRNHMRAEGMMTEPRETGTYDQWMRAIESADRQITAETADAHRRVCKYDVNPIFRLEQFALLVSRLLPIMRELQKIHDRPKSPCL